MCSPLACAYLATIASVLCPEILPTVGRSTPACTRWVIAVCLKVWRQTSADSSASATTLRKATLMLTVWPVNDFFGRIHELKTKLSLPANVHFLENESVDINGVLFIGATLWTDFLGKDFFKMQYARKNMNDFVVIKKADGTRLMPEETVDLFQESKQFIFEKLAAAEEKKTVVVTHHGVSPLSIHERFRGDSLNCAFMTDLSSEIIDHGPDLWVHGHTHNSFDYSLGKTRVVVNPYGYKEVEVNPQYDKQLIIDI